MVNSVGLPRRLIEVDLPIRRISEHARHEKSVRHGHISTLHLWWARRPLAACRGVLLAALLPDPADSRTPTAFCGAATAALTSLREQIGGAPRDLSDVVELRRALLDFIGDFANWDLASSRPHVETAHRLVDAAHAALSGTTGPSLVIDPFAGGGAIPFEALRVGATVYASDLNPVAVLLNRVVLNYLPKHGPALVEEVQRWGKWMMEKAETELGALYPSVGGHRPVAYLWARAILCEGPGCGARVPLLKSGWVSRKRGRLTAVKFVPVPKERRIAIELEHPTSTTEDRRGTIAKAHVLCPACGYTTRKDRVRAQLAARGGGVDDAILYAVAVSAGGGDGRVLRAPTPEEADATRRALQVLRDEPSLVPDEPIPQERVWKNNPIRVHLYGITRWSALFTPRQQVLLGTYCKLAREVGRRLELEKSALAEPVAAILALAVSRLADISNAHCRWSSTTTQVLALFGRQAISMSWDFAEAAPFTSRVAGNFLTTLGSMCEFLSREAGMRGEATVGLHSATHHPLPDDSAQLLFTDPPYYDAVPYATLADFFYVWLRRAVPPVIASSFTSPLIDKTDECVMDEAKGKDRAFFERTMTVALTEARRVVAPDGIGVIVFAHKSTAGWEAQLNAIIDAGWIVTGSWPIDTERADRMRARDSAALASSVHLVCRPREAPDGSLRTADVGDWRAVLVELPGRIREWLPRLASEGVVGADAIFACLGPALEIFSTYARVEKVTGEPVPLREYLEHVWAAVSREALAMIFHGAEAEHLEPDGRLTAMWLWTLAANVRADDEGASAAEGGEEEEDETPDSAASAAGFVMEFDAARKIAQGLGATLEDLTSVVEVSGETARLRSVAERAAILFPKGRKPGKVGKTAKGKQLKLLSEEVEFDSDDATGPALGEARSTLDQVHQAMLLFAAGRSDAMKRFLVEGGAGRAASFWRLAQSLSALYPPGSDEKRWIDGVLARKKGMGF